MYVRILSLFILGYAKMCYGPVKSVKGKPLQFLCSVFQIFLVIYCVT